MKLIQGNMFNNDPGIRLVTCNSYIKKNKALVMGRGAALNLLQKVPNINYIFGNEVSTICGHLGKYGVIIYSFPIENKLYGIFQVKYHFKDVSSLTLIEYSVMKLKEMLHGFTVHMNYPGIGNGKLTPESVLPIIKILPDNVKIYYL